MSIDTAYYVLLVISLTIMMAQVMFRPRRVEHILFAILCGSLSMMAIKALNADATGIYKYLFALGASATCNVFWLLSRAMFRGDGALSLRHYIFAGVISLLLLMSRSVDLFGSLQWLDPAHVELLKRPLREFIQLLSSTVLILSLWESIREYSLKSIIERRHRILFVSTAFAGIFSNTVISDGMIPSTLQASIDPWIVCVSAISIIIVTFVILILQHRMRFKYSRKPNNLATDDSFNEEDKNIINLIDQLMSKDKLYLQSELKMIDLANSLTVSEYKISRAIRNQTTSNNFNHYINHFRIEHAKQLLESEKSKDWTILVISLESGFASLAPFNRAFKSQEGCTPNQYRKL